MAVGSIQVRDRGRGGGFGIGNGEHGDAREWTLYSRVVSVAEAGQRGVRIGKGHT
jgi:hypothetical protein